MKTLTEFSGFVLREALAKKATWLQEGKTEEEVQTALNEFLKLDETKVAFYKNAVDMTQSRIDRLKRIVVAVKATETEKVPESFVERDGHFYLLEYFPGQDATQAKGRSFSTDRGGRGRDSGRGRDGGGARGREGGGRDSGRPPRNDRARGGDRPVLEFKEKAPSLFAPRDPSRDKPKEPRAPRAPRPPREPRSGPKGAGELRLVLKGQSATVLQPTS